MRVAQPFTGLLAVTSLLLAAGVVAVVCHAGPGPLYAVATVQAGLAHQPGAWVGRTVRVRGIAAPCVSADLAGAPPLCSSGAWGLVDGAASGAGRVLPLALGHQDGVLAFLRRLPLLSQLVAPPQTPHWWTLATYRVQVHAARCPGAPCYEALMVDAAP